MSEEKRDSSFARIQQLFQEGRYAEALQYMQKVAQAHNQDELARLEKGKVTVEEPAVILPINAMSEWEHLVPIVLYMLPGSSAYQALLTLIREHFQRDDEMASPQPDQLTQKWFEQFAASMFTQFEQVAIVSIAQALFSYGEKEPVERQEVLNMAALMTALRVPRLLTRSQKHNEAPDE